MSNRPSIAKTINSWLDIPTTVNPHTIYHTMEPHQTSDRGANINPQKFRTRVSTKSRNSTNATTPSTSLLSRATKITKRHFRSLIEQGIVDFSQDAPAQLHIQNKNNTVLQTSRQRKCQPFFNNAAKFAAPFNPKLGELNASVAGTVLSKAKAKQSLRLLVVKQPTPTINKKLQGESLREKLQHQLEKRRGSFNDHHITANLRAPLPKTSSTSGAVGEAPSKTNNELEQR